MSKSVRIPNRSYEQASELRQRHYESLTNVLAVAMDRLYRAEMPKERTMIIKVVDGELVGAVRGGYRDQMWAKQYRLEFQNVENTFHDWNSWAARVWTGNVGPNHNTRFFVLGRDEAEYDGVAPANVADHEFTCPRCGERYRVRSAHPGELELTGCDGQDGCGRDFYVAWYSRIDK